MLYKIACNTLLFLITGYFISCRCEDKWCKGLEGNYAQWIPSYNVGDSIRFVDVNGARMSFGVYQKEIPVPHMADCRSSMFTGCRCEACVYTITTGYISCVTPDTIRKIVDSTGNFRQDFRNMFTEIVQTDSNSVAVLKYQIFDHANTAEVDAGVRYLPNHNDSLLPSFTVGPRTYSNVIVHQVDTTINNPAINYPPYNVFFVYKTWFNKEYGIVAYYDLVTHSLFYRE